MTDPQPSLAKNLKAIRDLLTRWPDAWQEYEHYDEAQDRHSLGSAISMVANTNGWLYTPEAIVLTQQLGMEMRFPNGEPVLTVWASYPRRRIAHITGLIDKAIKAAK